MDDLFYDSKLFKLNFIGIQYLEYLDIREIKTPVKTPVKSLTLLKGQGFVEGHKILTLTLTLLTLTLDPWGFDKPLHITTCSHQSVSHQSSSMLITSCSPQKVNFTSRYQKKDYVVVNELDEYFKLPREDFDTCEPLNWW